VRASLDDRHAYADRQLEERDECRLPVGLEQFAHVVELSEVITVNPESVDLDVERADARRNATTHPVDHRAKANAAKHARASFEHPQRREVGSH